MTVPRIKVWSRFRTLLTKCWPRPGMLNTFSTTNEPVSVAAAAPRADREPPPVDAERGEQQRPRDEAGQTDAHEGDGQAEPVERPAPADGRERADGDAGVARDGHREQAQHDRHGQRPADDL